MSNIGFAPPARWPGWMVRQPIAMITNNVVEPLIAEISHQRPVDHHIILEPSLVVRESSARPRKAR